MTIMDDKDVFVEGLVCMYDKSEVRNSRVVSSVSGTLRVFHSLEKLGKTRIT